MITITKKPYPCTFSKNPIEIHAESNMQFPTPQVMPYLEIEVVTKANPGTTLTFNFINPETKEVQFVNIVASAAPEFSNEINTANLSGTLQQYAAACAERLRDYAPLNAWYDISSANKLIIFKAKYATQDLVITNLQSNQPVTHFILRNHVEWSNPDEREGYTMRALVYYENEYLSNDFKMVANLNCFIDGDGKAMIDVSNVIDAEIEAGMEHFPVPGSAQFKMDLLRRWYVEFNEYWNDNPTAIRAISDVFHTHWGGVSRNDELIGNPVALLQQQQQFLTWWPSGKQLFQKQKDWLSWMNTGKDGNYRFVIRIYTPAGVSDFNLPIVALKRWESMCRPVGYLQMDVPGMVAPGTDILAWSFQVLDADTDNTFVSPEFKYYLGDSRCFHTEILVWNSFGAAETISFIEVEETQQITTNLVDQSQLFNNHRWKPDMFIFESKHQNLIVAETTRLSKLEAYRLQSTLNSYMSMVWQGGRWVPAVISIDKRKVLIESELTTSLDFEMIIANSSDRASFFEATPKLIVVEKCGISMVTIDTQGIDVDDFGVLSVIDVNGADMGIVGTYTGNNTYTLDLTLQTSGLYTFKVTVLDYDGNAYNLLETVQYNVPIVEFYYDNTGFLSFDLTSISSGTELIDIDWGIGMLFQTALPYTGTATTFSENITDTGLKVLKLRKACFGDIIRFETSTVHLVESPFQYLTGLQYLVVSNAQWNSKLLLNGLVDMREIILTDCSLTGIEIGLMPMLKKLHIINCGLFGSDSIDEVIAEIWNMRKHFLSSGGYLDVQFLSGTSMSFSAVALKMINGTDEYTGEGLNSDYNFTFSIT